MTRALRSRAPLLGALLALALALGACDAPTTAVAPAPTGKPLLAVVPAKGTAATLDVASWNIEWFGDASNGPSNEPLQLGNARDVIAGADFDVWGVAEIVSQAQWNSLESQLPGYTGFLASESVVTGGSASYSASEQKVGILYRSSVATLLGAKIILAGSDADFAGRPPLEVTLRVTLNGATEDVVVIVLHMKAFNDATSWQRRQNAATALKSYLDATYPTQKVFVVGDWNDDVDTSITAGKPSPYAAFVADAARYSFVTKALTDQGISSTTGYPDLIDHHLATNEAAAAYVPGSVEAYRVDAFIPSYDATTSDHFPVLSRYTFGGGTGTTPAVTVTHPNGGESFAAGSAQSVTWTSSAVASVKLEYTVDGTTWSVIAASTPAAAGSYSWTVPSAASTVARVRVSDAAGTASDASDAAFTITTVAATPAQVVLNEVLVNEPGSNTAGEFVEIVNVGGTAASIGGWTLSDATGVRHTFAAGTTLAAGKALVVFGGSASIPAGLANAVAASTGTLSLGNGAETVSLRNGSGTVQSSLAYTSALSGTDGVSANRSPDASATGSWVLHTALGSLSSSAGKRASGAAF